MEISSAELTLFVVFLSSEINEEEREMQFSTVEQEFSFKEFILRYLPSICLLLDIHHGLT